MADFGWARRLAAFEKSKGAGGHAPLAKFSQPA